MNELDKIIKTVESTSLRCNEKVTKITLDDIKEHLQNNVSRNDYNAILEGMVRLKKSKQIDIVKYFFDLLINEVNDINSKQTGDDKPFFNANKKILSSNLINIQQILKDYNIDDEKIFYHILGTVIQYMYE